MRPALLVAAVALLALIPGRLPAQEATGRQRAWIGVGLGSGGGQDRQEVGSAMGEVVYQRGAHHVALRGVLLADPFGYDNDAFGELGALYGRTRLWALGHATIATGLSLVTVGSCETGDSCTAVGVPLVAEAAFRPLPVLGVGLQGFANFNSEAWFRGLALFLQLGWLP